jgi:lysophospholipase L1-like esterase
MVLALAVGLLAVSTSGASGSGGKFNPPKGYYLSLGDSMGFGLQFDKFIDLLNAGTYTPDAFNTGYTDDFATQMRQIRPNQQVVNLSCPAETTDSMINGPCPFIDFGFAIHTNYTGSQLDAAIALLKAHPGQVSPITIGIGANDALGVLGDQCNLDPTCIAQSGFQQQLGQNLDHILGALRAAAPNAEIIVVAYYNPFRIYVDPSTDQAWNEDYVQVEAKAAARNRAFFANGFAAISTTDQLCQLTFLCTSGDLHPTDGGYQVLANLIDNVSGYNRLTQN